MKKQPSSEPVKPSAQDKEENTPHKTGHDEEHTHGDYTFAVKVLAILAAIILVIVILQASGVPVAIRDWLFAAADGTASISSFPAPL